jgi:hypothetical protein
MSRNPLDQESAALFGGSDGNSAGQGVTVFGQLTERFADIGKCRAQLGREAHASFRKRDAARRPQEKLDIDPALKGPDRVA